MLQSWLDFWDKCSFSKRKDIFTTSTGVSMDKYGFAKDVTKKSIIYRVLNDVFNAKRFEFTNEIYFDILGFNERLDYFDIYEKLLLWTLEMEGCPFDNYWLYMTLEEYYSIQRRDIEKCIEVCKKSFQEIESYVPYLKASQNLFRKNNDYDVVGTLPDFIFSRDRLIYSLVDANRFEEAECYEKKMIKMNLFPDKNGQKRFLYNKVYLLGRYVSFLAQNNQIEKAIIKAEEYKKTDLMKSAFSFMEIADCLFDKQKYEEAHKYYCITFEINPTICGIDKRIQKTSKILNFSYIQNKNTVIQHLREREETLSNQYEMYELLNISQRYLEIEEYERAINAVERLIRIRGYENTLILHLSKIYKTMAKDKVKIKEYDSAISYYNSALNALNNTVNSTKTIEKQIDIIKGTILKLQFEK